MEITDIIDTLYKNKQVFEALLSNKKKDFYTWRPQPEKWNLVEVVCHLIDEEREDFRARVQHVLEKPLEKMTPFDPESLVIERAYAAQDYETKLIEFLKERQRSVEWLQQVQNPRWENVFEHPVFGSMSANLFLTNWLAHDFLHMRQIIRYEYKYLEQQTNIDLRYAGSW